MRPESGLGNGREVALFRVAQASASISARRVVQGLVGVAGAQEVGVADEEALLVVVGVDEPAGDALRPVAAHLAGVGVENVYAVDPRLKLPVPGVQDIYVRLAEDDEQVAVAGILQLAGHVQVGVHAGFQYRDAAQALELGGVGIVVEGAQAMSTSNWHSAASRAASTRSGLETVPNSGPMKIAALVSVAGVQLSVSGSDWSLTPGNWSLKNRPSAQTSRPGQGVREVKLIRSSLWACWTPERFRLSRMTC